MKKEENHVSIKAKHWTVAARSFLTLTTNVKHTIRKLCGPLEGDAPVSPSAIPAAVLLPFPCCLEQSLWIKPPEPLRESSCAVPRRGGTPPRDHRDPSPGPPGPLPGSSGRFAGSARAEPSPAHVGVTTGKRAYHRSLWAWLCTQGVPNAYIMTST